MNYKTLALSAALSALGGAGVAAATQGTSVTPQPPVRATVPAIDTAPVRATVPAVDAAPVRATVPAIDAAPVRATVPAIDTAPVQASVPPVPAAAVRSSVPGLAATTAHVTATTTATNDQVPSLNLRSTFITPSFGAVLRDMQMQWPGEGGAIVMAPQSSNAPQPAQPAAFASAPKTTDPEATEQPAAAAPTTLQATVPAPSSPHMSAEAQAILARLRAQYGEHPLQGQESPLLAKARAAGILPATPPHPQKSPNTDPQPTDGQAPALNPPVFNPSPAPEPATPAAAAPITQANAQVVKSDTSTSAVISHVKAVHTVSQRQPSRSSGPRQYKQKLTAAAKPLNSAVQQTAHAATKPVPTLEAQAPAVQAPAADMPVTAPIPQAPLDRIQPSDTLNIPLNTDIPQNVTPAPVVLPTIQPSETLNIPLPVPETPSVTPPPPTAAITPNEILTLPLVEPLVTEAPQPKQSSNRDIGGLPPAVHGRMIPTRYGPALRFSYSLINTGDQTYILNAINLTIRQEGIGLRATLDRRNGNLTPGVMPGSSGEMGVITVHPVTNAPLEILWTMQNQTTGENYQLKYVYTF